MNKPNEQTDLSILKLDIMHLAAYSLSMECFYLALGSISNIDDSESKCSDGSKPVVRNKVISGVVGASSSVTSIQVANLLRLFKIPQVRFLLYFF